MPKEWRAEAQERESRCAFAYFSPLDEGRSRQFLYEYQNAADCAAAVAIHNQLLSVKWKQKQLTKNGIL